MGALVASLLIQGTAVAVLLVIGYFYPNAFATTVAGLDSFLATLAEKSEPTGTLKLIFQVSGAGFALLVGLVTVLIGFVCWSLLSNKFFRWRRIITAGLIPLLAHAVRWGLGLLWPELLVPIQQLADRVIGWFDPTTQVTLGLFHARDHLMTIIIGVALLVLWSVIKFIVRRIFRRPSTPSGPTPSDPASGPKPKGEKMKSIRKFISHLGLISNTLLLLLLWVFWQYVPHGLYFLGAIAFGIFGAALGFILRKNNLTFNVDNPDHPAMFIQVDQNRSAMIERGGKPIRVIHGAKVPPLTLSFLGIWWMYQVIVYFTVGLYVYVPFFTNPKTYDLPRYTTEEKDGHTVYHEVTPEQKKFRSNHVRTKPFTWYFNYKGVDVQKVPVTTEGSAQVYIDANLVEEALYLSDSWNKLLDQAMNATTRSVMRQNVTVDEILGEIPRDIWAKMETPTEPALNHKVAEMVKSQLDNYTIMIDGKPYQLRDFGIVVPKIDFTDFKDELSEVERSQLRAAILGREEGRALDLRGQGAAAAQKVALDVHSAPNSMSAEIIKADAFVRASQGGNLDAAVAAFVKNQIK